MFYGNSEDMTLSRVVEHLEQLGKFIIPELKVIKIL